MALPKISMAQQRKIEVLLKIWKGKLSWNLLVKDIEMKIGLKTTRQTLNSYDGIYNVYLKRKDELRGLTPEIEVKIKASDIKMAIKLEKLQAEIKILKRNNDKQLWTIETMLYNIQKIPNYDLNQIMRERPGDTTN